MTESVVMKHSLANDYNQKEYPEGEYDLRIENVMFLKSLGHNYEEEKFVSFLCTPIRYRQKSLKSKPVRIKVRLDTDPRMARAKRIFRFLGCKTRPDMKFLESLIGKIIPVTRKTFCNNGKRVVFWDLPQAWE